MHLSKKQLIVKAFRELDADMLDVLLNEGQSYQDVPKDVFVKALHKHFEEVKEDLGSVLELKAYPGACNSCNKGKKGYSFVNSEGQCYMSMVFEEEGDDFKDIYHCGSFCAPEVEIEHEWSGISFYDDEKSDFVFTPEILKDEQECGQAMAELRQEVESQGILEAGFYNDWYSKYRHLDSIPRIFNGRNFSFSKEVGRNLFTVKCVRSDFKLNRKARQRLDDFMKIPVVTKDAVLDWLLRCDEEFSYARYGFDKFEINFRQDYFDDGFNRYRLSELYYYQNISEILRKYSAWLPDESSSSVGSESDPCDDDESFPF